MLILGVATELEALKLTTVTVTICASASEGAASICPPCWQRTTASIASSPTLSTQAVSKSRTQASEGGSARAPPPLPPHLQRAFPRHVQRKRTSVHLQTANTIPYVCSLTDEARLRTSQPALEQQRLFGSRTIDT